MAETEKEIILKYPIPVPTEGGGIVEVSKLTVGRLKLKHTKLLPSDFVERKGKVSPTELIPFIAGVTNIPEKSAEEIDFDDIDEIADIMLSFLAKSPLTGKK